MKKIGFIDYYLSEWHANNYPAWIKEACARLGIEEYTVAYAWGELELSPKYGETSAQWCAKYGAELCSSIEELCEKSDVVMILAPSDPEKHLEYATRALAYGKRTYIDKTFAPDLATAREIVALSERYGAPMFSTSALRYADELALAGNCRQVMVTGGGGNLPEYLIHQAEMVVKKMGLGAETVRAEQIGGITRLTVGYSDGRIAEMNYAPKLAFSIYMDEGGESKPVHKPVTSEFFAHLMEDIVRFYDTGAVSFDVAETLEVAALRETGLLAVSRMGETVPTVR